MSTVNQDIIAQIITNMKTISVANGFSFDISGRVYDYRETPIDDAELPLIIVRDPAHRMYNEDENQNELDIEVVLIVAPDDDSPADLRNKKQDIMNAFKLIEDETYIAGEGAQYLDSENQVEHTKKKYAGALMRFRIWYFTERWNL